MDVVLAALAGLVVGAALVVFVAYPPPTGWFWGRETPPAPARGSAPPPGTVPALLEQVDVATVVVDADDAVVFANGAAHAMTVVRGNRLAIAQLRELARDVRRDARTRHTEIDLPHDGDDAGPRAIAARVVALGGADVAVIATDLTDARRLAAVRRDFVANISHELKTPVGAVLVLAEALHEARDDPEAVTRFAERLHREADRLSALVRELIELSRLEGAGEPVAREAVDLRRVVDEAVERNRALADSRSIAVFVDADWTVRFPLLGDHERLTTAVANLLSNAVTYSPDGSAVVVTVRRDEDTVSLSVVDRGIGIDPTDVPRLFERFYRVDPARSRATGGSGLGLAIVKHAVRNHGGEVAVTSAPGSGSTFTIRLPLTPGEDARP